MFTTLKYIVYIIVVEILNEFNKKIIITKYNTVKHKTNIILRISLYTFIISYYFKSRFKS